MTLDAAMFAASRDGALGRFESSPSGSGKRRVPICLGVKNKPVQPDRQMQSRWHPDHL